MTASTFEYRAIERDGFCRYCDQQIKRGTMVLYGHSYRGGRDGTKIILHPECLEEMGRIVGFGKYNEKS